MAEGRFNCVNMAVCITARRCVQVLAAVQDVRGEVHLEAWSILFGADRTTWLHEKVVPDRLNEVCGASTSSTSLLPGATQLQKPSASWQVRRHCAGPC